MSKKKSLQAKKYLGLGSRALKIARKELGITGFLCAQEGNEAVRVGQEIQRGVIHLNKHFMIA